MAQSDATRCPLRKRPAKVSKVSTSELTHYIDQFSTIRQSRYSGLPSFGICPHTYIHMHTYIALYIIYIYIYILHIYLSYRHSSCLPGQKLFVTGH